VFSIFATINIKPENVEELTRTSSGDAQGSVCDEPGCFRFDINQAPDVPGRLHLHENFRDEAAFRAHRAAPHFLAWREKDRSMLDGDITRVAMSTAFPSDGGYEKQKPGPLNG